ncbi:MAG: hypothetical protein M3Q71_20645 [Chloroflexota bacterium]|nr:hypothetical protein [Chloroflexota bacterium]
MPHPRYPDLPFMPPDAAEAVALARAAAYLSRAGTQAASHLLAASAEAALLVAVRDELLAGAALCDGLLDLVASPETRQIHPPPDR